MVSHNAAKFPRSDPESCLGLEDSFLFFLDLSNANSGNRPIGAKGPLVFRICLVKAFFSLDLLSTRTDLLLLLICNAHHLD